MNVTVTLPDGEAVRLPLAQVLTIARLAQENPGSYWHLNECGCCVCLHPGGEKSKGWIIGSDGGADLMEVHA